MEKSQKAAEIFKRLEEIKEQVQQGEVDPRYALNFLCLGIAVLDMETKPNLLSIITKGINEDEI